VTKQSNAVTVFLDWLISMDDPDDENGRAERQVVTLNKIIEMARGARALYTISGPDDAIESTIGKCVRCSRPVVVPNNDPNNYEMECCLSCVADIWREATNPSKVSLSGQELRLLLFKHWDVFRNHHPVGAYLPIGQLDGDCSVCHEMWPCAPALQVLQSVLDVEPDEDAVFVAQLAERIESLRRADGAREDALAWDRWFDEKKRAFTKSPVDAMRGFFGGWRMAMELRTMIDE